jgi:hypothetical protein
LKGRLLDLVFEIIGLEVSTAFLKKSNPIYIINGVINQIESTKQYIKGNYTFKSQVL